MSIKLLGLIEVTNPKVEGYTADQVLAVGFTTPPEDEGLWVTLTGFIAYEGPLTPKLAKLRTATRLYRHDGLPHKVSSFLAVNLDIDMAYRHHPCWFNLQEFLDALTFYRTSWYRDNSNARLQHWLDHMEKVNSDYVLTRLGEPRLIFWMDEIDLSLKTLLGMPSFKVWF